MARGRAPRSNWQNVEKANAEWEQYYKYLGLPSRDPAEFEQFKTSCQTELPVTFRITGTSQNVVQVREIMEAKHISKLKDQIFEDKPVEPPIPLPFYPNRLAWQINVGKQVIRKNPQFNEFQRFLVVETNAGNVSRQELVSMIPPLFLEVEPHHTVLDTCASPGSKTAQLIEALHQKPNPTGFVIANDSDYKRSHMLTHQVKRLNSPNIMVTNHDAQMYPKIWTGEGYLKFDRILCDVPCTGDATMRKNINVWQMWKVSNGQGLHNLQLNIAVRSVHLLKSGGRLVYSTCSLNPIENEAVVAQLLRQFPNLELVDCSEKIPDLKRAPGISSWQVQDKTEKKWHDLDDMSTLPRSWFRPTDEEAKRFHLERAVRVYPHHQNSGGFFIAVLELKGSAVDVRDIENSIRAKEANAAKAAAKDRNSAESNAADGEPKAAEAANEEKPKDPEISTETPAEVNDEIVPPASKRAKLDKPPKEPRLPRDVPAFEEPFKFVAPDHPVLQSCSAFYGLKPDFKLDSLIVRNAEAEPVRTIYYVSPSMKPVLEHNDQKLKVIHAGIKLFNAQKNDGDCKWRVQSEGISMLRPFATKRVVKTSNMDALKQLCLETFIRFDKIKELDEELHAQLIEASEGCCFWELNGTIYPLWRGKASANLMSPKENTEDLLLRLFDIDKKKLVQQESSGDGPVNSEKPDANEVS